MESPDRIILSVEGAEKQGKTHFALTAPGPTILFSLDIGEEGVVQKFSDVYVMPMGGSNHEAEFSRFRSVYSEMLADKDVRTIVLDTATEVWELLRMARFGKLTQVMPYQYGPVNAEYRAMIREAYESDKNLILLHKVKAKYVNDKKTNEWERAGFADTGFLVQVNAMVYRDDDGGEFNIYIRDCRKNPDLAGETLSGPLCNFEILSQMVNS